ncbi:Pyridoxine/pyridoxamine 5'-phosphate oxidase [Trichinella pseudospiralis]|uniref:pyridoxal 5'-phosphate synthase n=2 Tax=Trichinella pseudospiralis TaxID=6337 RepID=A0A0V1J860_TRIPS|nr:Pyridoxine/pyridoxamine 5'-phosphate oxidase [Trichinella pseudospiralis]KRY93526.1 Pyridoxine/pyridoxamine 5'-phosphate oxidase [Trichinella pseudospiralis]KRZ31140.1 Pyridoxine/pyridoxamine 5'-phosphate oxidase [Trichinella pseudospiralis]KRZ43320.1 Pyridoxine/pyridoxamine 5'-phosphate oxidase [Trichinella pseudospiralis]
MDNNDSFLLDSDFLNKNPMEIFQQWYNTAKMHEPKSFPLFTLSTVDEMNKPHSRTMALVKYDLNGFKFCSNGNSPKANHLRNNQFASLCFYWPNCRRQVVVEGTTEEMPRNQVEAIFANGTNLEGKITNTALEFQSEPIASYAHVNEKREEIRRLMLFNANSLPCPGYIVGYNLIPDKVEFLKFNENYAHERIRLRRNDDKTANTGNESWIFERLTP